VRALKTEILSYFFGTYFKIHTIVSVKKKKKKELEMIYKKILFQSFYCKNVKSNYLWNKNSFFTVVVRELDSYEVFSTHVMRSD